MHKETVTESTLELIKKLQAHNSLKDFNLVGGTALALHLGHRISIDIDLFSENPFDANKLSETLEKDFGFEQESVEENTLKGSIEGVKVDFITHAYKQIEAPVVEEEVRLASIKDITAMKVNAICNSGERVKDFVDIYFLLKRKNMSEIIDDYSDKYSQRNPAHAVKSLNYFGDVDLSDWPNILEEKNLKWENVKNKITSSIVNYQKELVDTSENNLSKAIYNNDSKKVEELIKQGVKPNKRHLKLLDEMEVEKMQIKPDIRDSIKKHFPSKGKK